MKARLLSLVLVLATVTAAQAELKLPAFVSDHMVLQRDTTLPVWGWADPGAKVSVSICDQKKTAVADGEGRWEAKLDALKVGGPHEMTISDAASTVTIKDILVGDVWLCSGQSNMAMTVNQSMNPEEEAAAAKFPEIRQFRTGANARADGPQTVCTGSWQVCSPETVGGFTAAGYFFGRRLHQTLKVPIGLIKSSRGGTRVEAWTPRETLASNEPGKTAIAAYQEIKAKHDPAQAKAQVDKAMAKYEEAMNKFKEARKVGDTKVQPPHKPKATPDPDTDPNSPSALYNGMIQPLVPYAIRGAIWYQGERNARSVQSAMDYRILMPAMITSWRNAWGRGDFPFFFVQLPNYNAKSWPVIRESFLKTLETPRTGMAIAIDVGDLKDIHPKNKQAVGKRLALSALHVAYGQELAHSGPIYDSMKVEGGKMRLTFKYVFDGLQAKGDAKLTGFSIAGADKKFVPADAVIDGNNVVVSSPDIAQPAAVRYAWEADPKCNLFNKADLPASPFRTDEWPLK